MNAEEVAPVNTGLLVAANVYPVPDLFIERLLKVATPLTAATVAVPESVAAPGLVPIAKVTFLISVVTVLLFASVMRIVIAGLIATAAVALDGC